MNVIPFHRASALINHPINYSARTMPMPALDLTAPVVLTPEFAKKLSAFNCLTRALREAEIRIEAMSFLDKKIFIHPDSSPRLRTHFKGELRGVRWRTEGKKTRNTVTIRDIDVVWFTPVKEQNQ